MLVKLGVGITLVNMMMVIIIVTRCVEVTSGHVMMVIAVNGRLMQKCFLVRLVGDQ